MNEATLKSRLLAFKYTQSRLKELDQAIKEVWCNGGMKALTYDSPSLSEDNKFHSATEETAERNIESYDDLIKAHGRLDSELCDIRRRIARLDKVSQVIIEEYYFERKSWDEIADMIGRKASYTRKTLHRLAIEEMAKEG